MRAGRQRGEKAGLTMKQENALCAGRNSLATNIQRKSTAEHHAFLHYVGISSIRKLGSEPVYNMEVDEYHNFSVNDGIIVHNCMDDIRYMAQTVLRYRFRDDGYRSKSQL